MIFCLNNFPTKIFSKLKHCQKHGKNEKNNIFEYSSMIINKDNHMNQHSKYEKILS